MYKYQVPNRVTWIMMGDRDFFKLWHFNTVGTRKITQHDVVRKAFDWNQKLSVWPHSYFLAAIESVSLSP